MISGPTVATSCDISSERDLQVAWGSSPGMQVDHPARTEEDDVSRHQYVGGVEGGVNRSAAAAEAEGPVL